MTPVFQNPKYSSILILGFYPSEREIKYEMIKTGRKNYPDIILNETEMIMILDSLVEDGYVIGHKSDKPPYGLTYQYISGKK